MAQSPKFGGPGGGNSEQFGNPNWSLVEVRGKAGDYVDQVQFLFRDTITGQFHETKVFGGQGGAQQFRFASPEGQWITGLEGKTDNKYLTSLLFRTNQGATSDRLGQRNQHYPSQYFEAPKQGQAAGRIWGGFVSYGSLIDAIQFNASQ